MTDVRQTKQADRGAGWRLFAGVATVALAALIVVVGLGLLDGGTVGTTPTPSSATPSSQAASEEASSSHSATEAASSVPSPRADATRAEGEFGPIHSMTPEDAFGAAARCENHNAVVNGEPTDITFSVSYPADWYTNDPGAGNRGPCAVFGPEPFDPGPQSDVLASAVITLDIPFGGDFDPTAPSIESGGQTFTSVTTDEYTVDGMPALRYEYPAGGGNPGVIWVVGVAGQLPAVGNDRPYLFFAAPGATDPARSAEVIEVLDRMVATLDSAE